MDIFNVFTMIGGLALFLYGMHIMGEGLTKLSGGTLERTLEKLTTNRIKAVLLGAGVTAIIQSSSATTVMVVGFVNSGIMKLGQAIGIIMGANVGTTITSWILSLTGLESDNFFMQLLKPTSFSPILAAIGICFILFSKKDRRKDIGTILIGFAILMFGMDTMSGAVKPLSEVKAFTDLFIMFQNPFLGMVVGAILTAVIQSSSASVGILQSLCDTKAVTFGAALPIIMGQNIGTCITAIFSSVGATRNAKRAAVIHLLFNIIGTLVFMIGFYTINAFIRFPFLEQSANKMGIAIIHTAFNILATFVLLPFSGYLEKLSYLIVKVDEEEREELEATHTEDEIDFQLLDTRFLATPSFALEQCKHVTVKMAELTRKSLFKAMNLLQNYDKISAKEVEAYENIIDKYEDEIGSYLVQLSSKNLSEKDSHALSLLQHCINDFERMSDHALNIMEIAKEMKKQDQEFSNKAKEEIRVYAEAVHDIVDMSVRVLENQDRELAAEIEPLEEVIDSLQKQMKKRHVKRLNKGKCTVELGLMLSEITMNFERIADHCSNVAIYVLQIDEEAPTAHEFLESMPKQEGTQFANCVKAYKEKYILP